MMADRIDEFLSSPLEPVADDGFTQAVFAQIERRERNRMMFEWSAIAAVMALAIATVPAAVLVKPIVAAADELGHSMPFAIACAALALSLLAGRLMAEE